MAPFVSFILPCFNRAIYLEKCVQSILNQTLTDLECLIIDDGSTDYTSQVADKLIGKDSRVKYFYKDNGGVSSARNFGMNQAEGDWIQCLDPDDWIHEDKTRFQLSYLNNLTEKEVVFYCDYERVHLDEQQNIIKRVKRESLLSFNIIIIRFFFLPLKLLKVSFGGKIFIVSFINVSLISSTTSSTRLLGKEINRKTKAAYLSCLGFCVLP